MTALTASIDIDAYQSMLGSPRNEGFFTRVWSTPQSVYHNRLKAVTFENLGKVLDAGCGYGQWTSALAALNAEVCGVDMAQDRLDVAQKILKDLNLSAGLHQGSVEALPFPDNVFDGVFSYGVVCLTDYWQSLREFYRVLKPGGRCYFNANGLGWYVSNLLEDHHSTDDFSSRDMALDALSTSLTYYAKGLHPPGKDLVMPKEVILSELVNIGFKVLAQGYEGTINLAQGIEITPFFENPKYGFESVYEVLCQKEAPLKGLG